ncbi:MAG: Fic family protein [Desulfotalea sp.]
MLGDADFVATDLVIDYISQISELVGQVKGKFNPKFNGDYWQDGKNRVLEAYLSEDHNNLDLGQMLAVAEDRPLLNLPDDIRHSLSVLNILQNRNDLIVNSQDDLLFAHSWLVTGSQDGERIIDIVPPVEKGFVLLQDILNSFASSSHHPLINSSLLHYELAQSLAFRSGNRAIGRLWQSLCLNKWRDLGVCLNMEPYFLVREKEYNYILQESNKSGDERVFVEFVLSLVLEGLRDVAFLQEETSVSLVESVENVCAESMDLLKVMGADTCSARVMMERLSIQKRTSFIYNYLRPTLQSELIAMTCPDQPRSRNQRYYLTDLGHRHIQRP